MRSLGVVLSGLIGVLLEIWVLETPGSQLLAAIAAGWLVGISIGFGLDARRRP